MIAICLRTKNDTNGNPRRVWLINPTDDNPPTAIVREGFSGGYGVAKAAFDYQIEHGGAFTLDALHWAVSRGLVFDVTPTEYREWATNKRAISA